MESLSDMADEGGRGTNRSYQESLTKNDRIAVLSYETAATEPVIIVSGMDDSNRSPPTLLPFLT